MDSSDKAECTLSKLYQFNVQPCQQGAHWLNGALLALAFAVYLLNFGSTLNLGNFNYAERFVFLLASATTAFICGARKEIIYFIVVQIVLIVILGMFTRNENFLWIYVINALNQVVIPMLILAVYPTREQYLQTLKMISWLPIICVVLGIFLQISIGRASFGVEYATGNARLSGSLIPAYLSAICTASIISATVIMLLTRQKMYLVILTLNFWFLLLAGGRITLVLAAFASFMLIASSTRMKSRNKIALLYLALALVLSLVLYGANVFERFQVSGLNGRALLWDYFLKIGFEHFWSGIGFGHQYYYTAREIIVQTGTSAAHNDFIKFFVELGMPGSIVFLGLFGAAIHIRLQSVAEKSIGYITTACFVAAMLTDNPFGSIAWLPMFYIIATPKNLTINMPVTLQPHRLCPGATSL